MLSIQNGYQQCTSVIDKKKFVNPHWYRHNKHALLALKLISILSIYLVLTKTTIRIKKSLIVNTIA
jgi:maltodextrin utilization protein YvdJ